MNTQKQYCAEFRTNGSLIARHIIEAPSRAIAVHKAQLWYWSKYKGSLGNIHNILTVDDPYQEVRYDSTFKCSDKKNRHLKEDDLERIIAESNGELVRNYGSGTRHHPAPQLKRVKRRRVYHTTVGPNIRRSGTGALYYCITLQPQKSRNNTLLKKKKYRLVKLEARTMHDAIHEIAEKKLLELHVPGSTRNIQTRDPSFLETFAHTIA